MFIKEVCKECKLTKKAVDYYEQQGLISPMIEDNGYRNYSEDDIRVLKEIGVLRKLGISVADIKMILQSSCKSTLLAECKYKLDLEVEKSVAKQKCLEQLIQNYNIESAIQYIEENLERSFTIKEKLLQAFPGGFGMYLCIHFGGSLNEKIDSKEKLEAYEKIIDYLDKVSTIKLPRELEEYFLESFAFFEKSDMQRMNSSLFDCVENMEQYLEENEEQINYYLEYRNSYEYKETPAYKMQQLLLEFQKDSGYYDILIENLKILSNSYREYHDKLQEANKRFFEKYPQVNRCTLRRIMLPLNKRV